MTDTETKPTYAELEHDLAEARDSITRLRTQADDNYNKGREWKDHADKLSAQIKDLTAMLNGANSAAESASAEAAELRGYIRRVNELDPKALRNAKRRESEQAKIDRLTRRGY